MTIANPLPKPVIAVIAGDGIGPEVLLAGLQILEAVEKVEGFQLNTIHFPWGSEFYRQHGRMVKEGGIESLQTFDAIYFGAVGSKDVPDHVTVWDLILPIRQKFDQYVNLRPMRLLPGLTSPLASRKPADIDMVCVRENTEGEYSSIGGIMFEGTPQETVVQESIFTRRGTERIMKFAFELAMKREKKHLTSATKSNGIAIYMPWWDERFAEMARAYPEVRTDKFHIDILTAHFVRNPNWFDVVVASNLFGDILSDLGPACTGTIGIAPSANLNPERNFPSLFEPVHGSAPDIYGKGIANPIGQIWCGAMMLEHLGHLDAANTVMRAIELVLAEGPRTPDMGGKATTSDVGKSVAAVVTTI